MKTSNLILLILLLLCQCTNDSKIIEEGKLSMSPNTCFPAISDKYIYPVTPGMEEWQTSDDVYQLVQLPDSILRSISTLGLIDALVNSPLFAGSYLLSNSSSPVDTWHRHYERFNCANELFQRKDAGDTLVDYYKLICFDCLKSSNRPSDVKERIMGLEFLFTKQEILDNIEHIKKQELITSFLEKYKQMPDDKYRIIPMVWIMHADKYSPLEEYFTGKEDLLQTILLAYVYPSDNQMDMIISFAKSFINEKVK